MIPDGLDISTVAATVPLVSPSRETSLSIAASMKRPKPGQTIFLSGALGSALDACASLLPRSRSGVPR